MVLSQIDINIITDEIEKDSNNKILISKVKSFKDQSLLDLLISEKNLINQLPKSVINYYIDDIKYNFREILSNCSIQDISLLTTLINLCVDDEDIHKLSRKAMINTPLNPQELHFKFPDFFKERVVLNYSPVMLEERFLFKLKDFLGEMNTGFFILQPVTKSLIKKVIRNKNKTKVDRFFETLNFALNAGTAKIDEKALKYCIHPLTVEKLLCVYQFKRIEHFKIYNSLKNDEKLLICFVKNQNISKILLKYLIKKDIVHYYLAYNPYCSDETLINLHKTNKNINWLYVNTHINISEHVEYAKYLYSVGELNVIEYNLLISDKEGKKINNLRTLQKLNVSRNILYEIFAKKVSEIDIGLHSEFVKKTNQ